MDPFSLDHIFHSYDRGLPQSQLLAPHMLRHMLRTRSRFVFPVPNGQATALRSSFPRVVKEQWFTVFSERLDVLGCGNTRRSWAWLELN